MGTVQQDVVFLFVRHSQFSDNISVERVRNSGDNYTYGPGASDQSPLAKELGT